MRVKKILSNLITLPFNKNLRKGYFSYILYKINYLILSYKNKKISNLGIENYKIKTISFEENEMHQIQKDINIKEYYFEKKSKKYMLYDYDKSFLTETSYAWGFNRVFYTNLIEKKLGDYIREILNSNYRIENIWLYKNPTQSKNRNATLHLDSDMFSAIKLIIYLSDVDEESGPFEIFDILQNKRIKITGKVGTAIFFDQNKLMHAGSPNLSKERIVLSCLIFPTIHKKINYIHHKPLNNLYSLNPFTKSS